MCARIAQLDITRASFAMCEFGSGFDLGRAFGQLLGFVYQQVRA